MERWLIGYGSLIWKPGFEPQRVAPATLSGWTRRFWQGSPDHRGTPEAPGRVATILPDGETTIGVRAYRVAAEDLPHIQSALQIRERAGYSLASVEVELDSGEHVQGQVYIAGQGNPSWLGAAPVPSIAAQVRRSHGPSGSNLEYVQRLARALAEQGTPDPHVNALLAFASPFGTATDPAENAVRRFLGDAVGTRVVVLGDTPKARETRDRLQSWGARIQHMPHELAPLAGPVDLIIDAGAQEALAAWAEAFEAPVLTEP